MSRVGLRERKVARTRSQIALAARECFLKQGYASTTLDEIAEAADICKRTVLRYFPTKAHLVLYPQYAALENFKEAVKNRDGRPVLEIWEEHVRFYARSRTEALRSSDLGNIVHLDPDITPAMLLIGSSYREILAREICIDLGRDPASDVRSKVAAAALAIGSFTVANMILAKQAFNEMEAAELEVIRIVREGILNVDAAVPPNAASTKPKQTRRANTSKAAGKTSTTKSAA